MVLRLTLRSLDWAALRVLRVILQGLELTCSTSRLSLAALTDQYSSSS